MPVVLLIIELISLYFISRSLSRSLFTFFLIVFRSRPVAVSLLLVLTFPGTVLHELAHLFTAEILRVRTGKLSLVPESIRESDITSGSVAIAETDPFRRYAIGLAPIFVGLIVLAAIAYLMPNLSDWSNWTNWVTMYLLFAVSNTMFSSPQDLKGFIPFIIVLLAFVVGAYLLGIRFELSGVTLELFSTILETLVRSLGTVLGINGALLIITTLFNKTLIRAFRP